VKYAKLDAPTLREMIDKTIFSVSSDETRFQLSGVFFECDGKKCRMVSTDGHRLSKIERGVPEGPKLDKGVIIPKKGLGELKRAVDGLGGACEVAVAGGSLYLRTGDVALSVKLIEAEFPPYEQVIPAANDKSALVPREPLLSALKRTSHMTSDKTSGVKLGLEKNVLRIASDNPDLGEAKEELPVEYTGGPITIGFNANYFKDLLTHMTGDRVRLELTGELDPGVIRSEGGADYVGVIMPMRI
jgi:DNA polymerase-3 subunit beta